MTIDKSQDKIEADTSKIRLFFLSYLKKKNYRGIFGVAKFSSVFKDLLPIQQNVLKKTLQLQLDDFLKTGSIISLGICYPPEIIDCINVKKNGIVDKKQWNLYSDEYKHLNDMLKEVGNNIAHEFNGIAMPPTTEMPSEKIKNVKDYYSETISHRLVAEYAGIGWRGKCELLITDDYGPALRFVSVLTNIPLRYRKKMVNKCNDCNACLEICPILKNKAILEDYRENCRLILFSLGLKHDVCGKCIKACYRNSIFKKQFKKF